MVLVLSALTGVAFGTGVMVGLADRRLLRSPVSTLVERLVGSGWKTGLLSPRPEAREEQPRRPGRTKA